MLKALNIKGMHVKKVSTSEAKVKHYGEEYTRLQIDMDVAPFKRLQSLCPVCHEKCSGYDYKSAVPVSWRANSFNGVPVFLHYRPKRIFCPKHGVKTEYLPWSDGNSRFTASFNNEIAFMALNAPEIIYVLL